MQSTSGRQEYGSAETVLGVAAAGQSVMGMPSDISHIVHPDGRKTPAMFVEVSADCKVVLIVVRSLHMSPGKIGAQCAHAAVGLYKVVVTNRAPWLSAWESAGEKTVVLAVDTAQELKGLAEQAEAMSLATFTLGCTNCDMPTVQPPRPPEAAPRGVPGQGPGIWHQKRSQTRQRLYAHRGTG
ncbi:MAG: hypothetical protein FRX49_06051 [Trebouxia sp. A1-2]|nr:MAG: hypothetical protein FRX49_06051 [Trebouxia sp. A1-2]